MRRAKEDDRLFPRQWRRIPAQKREKRSRHTVYTNASTRSKEAAPVARYCRTACASRSIINYRKSDQSKVTKRRQDTRLITPCFPLGPHPLFRALFIYLFLYFFLENYVALRIRYRFSAIPFSSTTRNMSIRICLLILQYFVQHFFTRYTHFTDIHFNHRLRDYCQVL